ncbi:MAG TPA: tetratricopeptide repeat protein [Anaerolineales bacterium]
MSRRRKRPNWFRIILLSLLVLGGSYFNRYILPTQPSPFVPTPTVTRDPESYVTQADELFNQGKLLPAIDSYQQAIAVNPNDPAVYVAQARVQVWAGLYADAETSAEDALLLNPNNSMAHAVRAWALDFQGNFLEAESAIKRALELDPNNGLAHAYYVEILIDSYISGTGSYEGINTAIEESKVALALLPNTLEAHRARAYILEATANYEEAIREYQAAVAINANIADLHLSLGRNYRALGIYDQAVEEFTRANALNPGDPTPDLLISRTYATIGEYAKAAQYAESAVKDNPTDTNLHGNLGVMYYHNLLWPEAVKELTLVANGGLTAEGQRVEAINLIPDTRIAEYYFTYGLALARLNRCGEALKIAQMLQERVPSDEIAVTNADEINNICRRNLNQTATPSLTAPEGETTPAGTPTP